MPSRSPRPVLTLVIVAAVVLAGVLVVGLSPFHLDSVVDPFVRAVLAWLQSLGAPSWVDYDFMDFLANIVFFVPIGFLAAVLLPRRVWWVAIVIGAVLSSCIELAQLLFLAGRDASWTDVLANTTGALLGAVIGFATRLARRQQPRPPASPQSAPRSEPR